MSERFNWLQKRTGQVLALVGVLTALLLVPFLAMAPDESASTEPSGDVYTARDRIDEKFVSSVHAALYIVDSDRGDLLLAEPLSELLDVQDRLRNDPDLGPTLFNYFEAEIGLDVNGSLNLADLVQLELASTGISKVSEASDVEVKAAGAAVIERYGERSELLGLSAKSIQNSDGDWVIPALAYLVLSDDEVLGFGNTSINFGGDTEVEEYDRDVQEILRQAEDFEVNGVAIDLNLTSEEQGAIAGPFIGFTILAVLLLVGLTFRSYWVLATVSVAFMVLLIWLKGISNLIGLKDDLVLSLIVPVAMISFGVDFAFHAVGRYREERAAGHRAGAAFSTGLAAVSGALVLALASDATAFLSNLTSGIESINQFGVGAAVALASAYILLGIMTPLVVTKIESDVPAPKDERKTSWLRVLGAAGAASLTMASVLLLVFVLPWLGVLLAGLTAAATLVIPYIIQRRKLDGLAVGDLPISHQDNRIAKRIGGLVASLASRPAVVLPTAAAITAVAAVFALQVPTEFDVEDFFAADTDFVESLNQLDEHVGDRGGEQAFIYVEGDLGDPEKLAKVAGRIEEIKSMDTGDLARDSEGIDIEGGIFNVFDAAFDSEPMLGLVQQETGVLITDDNQDGIPDTREQVEALISVAAKTGVPFDSTRLILTPDDVNTIVQLDEVESTTIFELGLVNSRSQEVVTRAKADLEPIADAISDDLDGSFVQLTGSPFVREDSLAATNRALQISLPIALGLCLLLGTVFLRSVRYGLASIVPILMVIAWLYAFMEIAGYAINLVTATIAAVSVGIGIDFAIHFISRYREELARSDTREQAVLAAGEGTGMALVASAISSAIGFGLLALAPMPLFAAYGLLTALMIVLALIATLAVLPSLLVVMTKDAAQ